MFVVPFAASAVGSAFATGFCVAVGWFAGEESAKAARSQVRKFRARKAQDEEQGEQ